MWLPRDISMIIGRLSKFICCQALGLSLNQILTEVLDILVYTFSIFNIYFKSSIFNIWSKKICQNYFDHVVGELV